MAPAPPRETPIDAIVAGVNKAGTTSLFVSLSTHPDVTASAIKETRYFLPARYGQPLAPFAEYQAYFAAGPDAPVHLEATPSLLYGGAAVASAIAARCPEPRIIVVLREPVARTLSFFTYQKVRLRFPADLSFSDYLAAADRLTDADFDDPANEPYLAVRGSRYADFLPAWFDTFGADRVHVVWFEDMVRDDGPTVRETAVWLGLDPGRFPTSALSSENRTTGYKHRGLQRVALGFNDRFERVLRRNPELKRKVRALYFRFNGTTTDGDATPDERAALADRFVEPNRRLAALLDEHGIARPSWLPHADT